MNPQEQEAGAVPRWDLADRMKKSLRHAGLSRGQMAAYLEVDPGSVSNWINGHHPPSVATLRLWALRTGVPFEWLKDGEEPEAPFPVPAKQLAEGARTNRKAQKPTITSVPAYLKLIDGGANITPARPRSDGHLLPIAS